MGEFKVKVKEVIQNFINNDLDLGFRRLVDCVLDTKNLELYQKVINYNKLRYSKEFNETDFKEKCISFLNQVSSQEIKPELIAGSLIQANEITKSYRNKKFQLKNVSLEINSGDVWGIVGENGNGKTTLLRILAKELSYDSGSLEYHLDKNPGTEKIGSLYDLRCKLVYIPQRTKKWYGSLMNNLKFTASHYGLKGKENELTVLMYIIRFGLWEYRNFNWNELSSGFKMRFELARTFLRSPKVLFLDEPLANLDILAQQTILDDLKHLSQNISNPIGIILSSQQLYEVEKISDKVLFLKKGEPKLLYDENNKESKIQTIVEIDIHSISKEKLTEILYPLPVLEINFNGGIFIIKIDQSNCINEFLNKITSSGVQIKYFRDISLSSRRFFK